MSGKLLIESLESRRLLSTVDVGLSQDTFVRAGDNANINYGGDIELVTKTTSSNSTRRAFLQVDLTSLDSLDTAELRLFGYLGDTVTSTVDVSVYAVSDDSWDEDTLTWNIKPSYTSGALDTQTIDNYTGTPGGGTVAEWYSWDISAHARTELAAGRDVISLMLLAEGSQTARVMFHSKENPSGNGGLIRSDTLDAPTNLSASTQSTNALDLVWADNTANESGFEVQRKDAAGNWSSITTNAADDVTYTDGSRTADTLYTYRVRATGSAGNSPWSAEFSGSTRAALPEVDDFDALTLAGSSAGSVTNWQPYSGGGPAATLSPVTGHDGTGTALSIDYQVTTTTEWAWGGAGLYQWTAPQDWSAYDAIDFRIAGGNTGGTISVLLRDNVANGQYEQFRYQFADDFTGWRHMTVPFTSFVRSPNQPAGTPDDGLTLTSIHSLALQTMLAPGAGPLTGSLKVDEVGLVAANANLTYSLIDDVLSITAASGTPFYLDYTSSALDVFNNADGSGVPLYSIPDSFQSLVVNSGSADSGTLNWNSGANALVALASNGGEIALTGGGSAQFGNVLGTGSLHNHAALNVTSNLDLDTAFYNDGAVTVSGSAGADEYFGNYASMSVGGDITAGYFDSTGSMNVAGDVTVPQSEGGNDVNVEGDFTVGGGVSTGEDLNIADAGTVSLGSASPGRDLNVRDVGSLNIAGDVSPGNDFNLGVSLSSGQVTIGGNVNPGRDFNIRNWTVEVLGNAAPGQDLNNAAGIVTIMGNATPARDLIGGDPGSKLFVLGNTTTGDLISNSGGTVMLVGDVAIPGSIENTSGTLLFGGETQIGGSINDSGEIIYFDFDLAVDSNNDGVIDETDNAIEDDENLPGRIIAVNDDDDDEDGNADMDQTGTVVNEDDLVELKLGDYPSTMSSHADVELSIVNGANDVRIYSTPDRATELTTLQWPAGDVPDTVWVEAVDTSTAVGDIQFALLMMPNGATKPASQKAKATVAKADMTAFRPTSGYATFGKAEVSDIDEASATLGPGIRRNGLTDTESNGENDLIEVSVSRPNVDIELVLRRANADLKVYSDANGGTEIPFNQNNGSETAALSFAQGTEQKTIWVEWIGTDHGTTDLSVKVATNGITFDTVKFHTFQSIIVGLGGLTQDSADAAGTGQAAEELYAEGYDAWWFSHADYEEAEDEIVIALNDHGIQNAAMWGYSLGGNRMHDIAGGLTAAGLGGKIRYTAYIDAIDFFGPVPVAERQKPPSSPKHDAYYQTRYALHGNQTDEDLELLAAANYVGLDNIQYFTPVTSCDVSGDIDIDGEEHMGIDAEVRIRNAYVERTRGVLQNTR